MLRRLRQQTSHQILAALVLSSSSAAWPNRRRFHQLSLYSQEVRVVVGMSGKTLITKDVPPGLYTVSSWNRGHISDASSEAEARMRPRPAPSVPQIRPLGATLIPAAPQSQPPSPSTARPLSAGEALQSF